MVPPVGEGQDEGDFTLTPTLSHRGRGGQGPYGVDLWIPAFAGPSFGLG